MKVFVSTHPFGSVNPEPLHLLAGHGVDVELNPYGRKITIEELRKHLCDKDALIAGTERINDGVLACAPNLKLIARVGIGLDNIDFDATSCRGILVTYTPEAVSEAVAELTVANMLNLARRIPEINATVKSRGWNRLIGFELAGKTIGIIGFGRVGTRVARILHGFQCRLLVNDIAPDQEIGSRFGVSFCDKGIVYRESDIITLHVPKTPLTERLVGEHEISLMKRCAYLINTSRGGIIDEGALLKALTEKRIAGAAVDVYDKEPYDGPLCDLDNVILTAHSGSCSREARYQMELGAAREVARFASGEPPLIPVPDAVRQIERSLSTESVSLEWNEVSDRSRPRLDGQYRLYRQRWLQYPTHHIVAPYPLNLDIELVHNPLERHIDDRLVDYLISERDADAQLMDFGLFEQVMAEYRTYTEPVAVKLGGRGSVLAYPRLSEVLEQLMTVDCVESIISVGIEEFGRLDAACLDAMARYRLQILNVFMGGLHTDGEGVDAMVTLLKLRAAAGHVFPKLRVVGRLTDATTEAIEAFIRYWQNWADVVALEDPGDTRLSVAAANPLRARLWQRLMVSAEGQIMASAVDTSGASLIGRFPALAIRSAWLSERMQTLRASGSDPCNEVSA